MHFKIQSENASMQLSHAFGVIVLATARLCIAKGVARYHVRRLFD